MAEDIPRSEEVHTTIGYEIDAHDGGHDPFDYDGEDWPSSAPHCPQCTSLLDFEYVARAVTMDTRWDFAFAGARLITSKRAYEACLRAGANEDDFRLVDPRRRLFELWPRRVLKVDLKRSDPRLEDFCVRCGNFECCMFYRGLYFAEQTTPLGMGFYRTDLVWGQGKAKSPTFIVAPETMLKLKAARFRRLRFRPVPYANPDFDALVKTLKSAEEHRRWRENELKAKKNGGH